MGTASMAKGGHTINYNVLELERIQTPDFILPSTVEASGGPSQTEAAGDREMSPSPAAPDEIDALPVLSRGSALRFFLTRLYDWLTTPEGALVVKKDPLEYLKKLRFHRQVEKSAEYGLQIR